jgi:4-hydroxy-tetrahydrodipicolinate reductase
MGRVLIEMIDAADDLQLASALERQDHPELNKEIEPGVFLTADAEKAILAADVCLDFSLCESVVKHAQIAAENNKPFVSGTTGFSAEQKDALDLHVKDIPMVLAYNMSRGVHVLSRLVSQANQALAEYDAEIFEIHHNQKADSPSGTAVHLAKLLEPAKAIYGRKQKRQANEVGLSSARGGDVVGEHQVMFFGPGEQIILTHRATSRKHFCAGALDAVRFVARAKIGLYNMANVFKGVN